MTNWPQYEAELRSRGSLTLWLTPEALAPRRTTPGGQPQYPEVAIGTVLMPGGAFQMKLRQSEGLARSVIDLMGLTVAAPDHTTLSRPVAAGEAWREVASPLAQAASGGRCRQRVDRGAHADGLGRR